MAAISALMIDTDASNDGTRPSNLEKMDSATSRTRTPKPADITSITHAQDFADRDTPSRDTIGSPMAVVEEPRLSITQPEPPAEVKRSDSDAIMDADSTGTGDNEEASDEEGEQDGDDENASRKKRGQRFFCTGYPPCNLSFTRSEHLARHIRKHTGERPFQCHCNRRFSRLDNLRQHAQTVHVNEEIPGDSLAATGTRYQRQIRTDRVRPVARPRSGTASTTTNVSHGHNRGHSRNLSTSSIASTSSVYSNVAADARRRPPPLLMSNDNRPTTPPTYSHFSTDSPGAADLTTPTSTTFPATPSSPNFSIVGSPSHTLLRPNTDAKPPSRRLSVPAGYNPYYPYANPNGPSYGPGPAIPSTPSSTATVTSPLSTSFPQSQSSPYSATEDWRRRTWHSSTFNNTASSYHRPATSGLIYSQTPDAPQPAYNQSASSAAGQAPRLPGIESFDQVQHRPTTPPRSRISPSLGSVRAPPPLLAAPDIDRDRRLPTYGHAHHTSWDGSRRSLYPEIDDHGRPATSWGRQTLDQMDQSRGGTTPSVMGPPSQSVHQQQAQQIAHEALSIESASKRVKRSGQYPGFVSAYRTSPDSSSSEGIATPSTSAVEVNPAIIGSNGYIESHLLAGDTQNTRCLAQPPAAFAPPALRPARRASELDRLDALVAVATSRSSQ